MASSLALPWEGVTGMGKAPSNGKALWVSCVCRTAAHTQEGTSFSSWGEAYQGLVALCLLFSELEGGVRLFIGKNGTHWLSGLDYLLVLRCCEETYFVLFDPCLSLLEMS